MSDCENTDLVEQGNQGKQHEDYAEDAAEPKEPAMFFLNQRQHLVVGPLRAIRGTLEVACGQGVARTILLRDVRVRALIGKRKVEPLGEEAAMERHLAPIARCNA